MSRKGALETCGEPADKQASKESGEPHLTSSEVVSPDLILHQHKKRSPWSAATRGTEAGQTTRQRRI